MEKRALLAVVLSIIVLGVWQVFFGPRPRVREAPPEPPRAEQPPPGDAAAAPEAQPAPPPAEAVEPVAAAARREFIVETGKASIRLTNEGGRILSWRLLEYVDDLKAPLEVVPRDLSLAGDFPFRIALPGDPAVTELLKTALFREDVRDAAPEDSWPGGGFKGRIVSFEFSDGSGLHVLKRLALPSDGYVGRVEAQVQRAGIPVPFELTWAVGLPEPLEDKTSRYFHAEGQGVAQVPGRTLRFPVASTTAPQRIGGGQGSAALLWGGLESTYFASLLLPETVEQVGLVVAPASPATGEAGTGPPPLLAARFSAAGAAQWTAVVGPKDYDLLVSLGRDIDHAIDFSRYSIIYAVTKWLFLGLRWLNGYVGNYGVSIVLLTLVIRAGFFPLTYRSSVTMRQNMKKMQKIQPRVKAIQERYRKQKRSLDTQRSMNDEIMAIYRKEGINPMGSLGGCLPLLLQMPVFIAFYNLLSVTIELRGAPFVFWVRDLSRMDPYYVWPILMGISWMVQQWMTSASIPDPMQRRLMGMMPILFTFMMARMPSGLVIYWFFSNVIGLVQQYVINQHADRAPDEQGSK